MLHAKNQHMCTTKQVKMPVIVPNIRVRPIWWTYVNVCIRSRMIRNIRLKKNFLKKKKEKNPFFGFFFLIFIIQKSDTHTHPLSL